MKRLSSFVVVLVLLAASRAAPAQTPNPTGEVRRFEGTADPVLDVAFLPDGRRIAFATGVPGAEGADHSVHLVEAETGAEVRRFVGHEKAVQCVAISPDGKTLASGGLDETVRLWDVETGRELEKRHVHRAVVLDVAFSPDGKRAITGSWDYLPMDYWDVASRKSVSDFGKGFAPVAGVVFTPDGRRVLAGHGDKFLRLWDAETGQEVRRFEGHEGSVNGVALSPDGRRALSAGNDGTVRLWDVETGKPIRKFEGVVGPVQGVAFSPDGRRALSGGDDRMVRLWDSETGAVLALFEGHSAGVRAVAFSPDGRRGLSGGMDRTARLWDLALNPDEARRAIAVLDFADLGPSVELAVLRKALAEMLIGDLSREPGLRVVERGRVEHVLGEIQLGKGGLVDAPNARRAGRELAADFLLTGSIAGTREKVAIKAALTRPGSEKPAGEWAVEGPSEKLFDLERDLAAKIRASLGLGVAGSRPSPSVAVLGFKDLSPAPRLKEMESGFSEILQGELAGLEGVRLVERARLDALLAEQKLSLSGLVAADSAARVGRLLGAERMVFGSFIELGTNLRVEARLVDTETAAVLHAETAEGPSEKFADLLGDLARKLARDLTAQAPKEVARRRSTHPGRSLEAARHFAAGKDLIREGRHAEAAAAFERALLLEPDNLDAHYLRSDSWFRANQFDRSVEAARAGLARTFAPDQLWAKEALRRRIAYAYIYTRQTQKHLELLEEIVAEAPASPEADQARVDMVGDLIALGRRREGVALLKKLIDEAKGGADRAKFEKCLREGFAEIGAHHFGSPDGQEEAALALSILDLMLKAAEDHRGPEWDAWAPQFPVAIALRFNLPGRNLDILPPEKRVEYQRRVIKVFPDLPRVVWGARLAEAKDLESLGRWAESREAYRYVAGHPGDAPPDTVPSAWDSADAYRRHGLNEVIRARVKAAMMLGDPLKDRAGAAGELRSILRDYGLAHQQGAILATLLKQHGEPVEFPGKAALVVGGGADGWRSWGHVLGPMGYTAHPYDLDMLTGANLAPYSLVVLARQGGLAFEPQEILALRSYVATGGSLLVVVSPGWSPAQPGVLNPLLAFFGVHARPEALPVRIWGNLSDDHPLVKGLERRGQLAKRPVELDAPAGSMAVRWYEKKVMVALPYREGRVVVSSFGQWFLPDLSEMGEWWMHSTGLSSSEAVDQAPMEGPEAAMLPLLKNAVAWLDAPIAGRPEGRRLPEDFLKAHRAALGWLYRLAPRAEMIRALDGFVAGSGSGERREEALWVAGESVRPLQWFHNNSDEMMYAWKNEEGPPRLDPRYFEELARSFPKSELAPFARWEAAEFDRLNRVYDLFRDNGGWVDEPIDADAVIPAFEKVGAARGSYAWAWARLRLAMLHTQAGHPEKALEEARPAADLMEMGPEKVLALLLAADASARLGQSEQAGRYLQFVKEVPEVAFPNLREDSAWAPATLEPGRRRIRFSRLPVRFLANEWEKKLRKAGP